MKVIETKGITYLEKFDETAEWYWGSNYTGGDLYEAEEIFNSGNLLEPNKLIFVHYPNGKVFEPIVAKANQYFGRPAFIDGSIYILLVAFDENVIRVYQCEKNMCSANKVIELPLSEVKDCYNIRIDGNPVMVTRQSSDNVFQIIWPEKVEFTIGARESFWLKKEDKLYFSEWHEDPNYREDVNVRDCHTGKLIEKIPGAIMSLPNNQMWILR